jgi:hypothetical protein
MGGLSPGILREAVQQVISVPYDPSSIEYEADPIVDANQQIKVKQEGVYRDAHHAKRSVTNIPAVLVAAMNGCPKVSDLPSRKQKGINLRSSRCGQGKPTCKGSKACPDSCCGIRRCF